MVGAISHGLISEIYCLIRLLLPTPEEKKAFDFISSTPIDKEAFHYLSINESHQYFSSADIAFKSKNFSFSFGFGQGLFIVSACKI